MSLPVQDLILRKRSEKLTSDEIKNFVSLINSNSNNAAFNLTLFKGLDFLDLEATLILLLQNPNLTTNYVLPICLIVRKINDLNFYLYQDKVGYLHILGFLYWKLKNQKELLENLLIVFISKGAKIDSPIFKNQKSELIPSKKDLTVLEWLKENNLLITDKYLVKSYSELRDVLSEEESLLYGLYLEMPQLMKRTYKSSDWIIACKAHVNLSILKSIPISPIFRQGEYLSLIEAVRYLNSLAAIYLLDSGQRSYYLMINNLITTAIYYKNRKNNIALLELENILLASVSHGSMLDNYQYTLLSTLGGEFTNSILSTYKIPSWRKECSSEEGEISLKLKQTATVLNIDTNLNKKGVCRALQEISAADKTTLEEAAYRRQQIRLNSNLGRINEFLEDNSPSLVCRNSDRFKENPLKYNDIDLAYYRDDEGAVWCFTSDTFSLLEEQKKNIYNDEILPENFLRELQYKITMLKTLEIFDGKRYTTGSITFLQALEKIEISDSIDNKISEKILQNFINDAMEKNNLSLSKLEKIDKETYSRILNSLGFNLNFNSLSNEHTLVTVSYAYQILSEEGKKNMLRALRNI